MATKIEDNMRQNFQHLQQTWIKWGISLFFSCWFLFLQLFWEVLWRILAQIYQISSLFSSVKWSMFLMGETFHSYTSSCHTVPNISKPNLQKSPNWQKNTLFLHQKPTNIFDVQAILPLKKILLKDPKPTNKKTGVFENPGIVDEIFILTEISYFHGRFLPKKHLSGWWFQPISKMCSSKWESFPQTFGVKMKKIFELPPTSYVFNGQPLDHRANKRRHVFPHLSHEKKSGLTFHEILVG